MNNVVFMNERDRGILNRIRRNAESNGIKADKVQPSYLRVAVLADPSRSSYDFNVRKDVGVSLVHDKKLDQNDSFIISKLGMLLLAEAPTNPGTGLLQTYPNNTIFAPESGNVNPLHLNIFYNGFYKIKVDDRVFAEAIATKQSLLVRTAQQSALANIPAPGAPVISTATTGGALAAATYYYKITAVNSIGETIASAEVSITTTGTTSANTLTWAPVIGAAYYKVYRGTAAGAENVFYATLTASFVDTGAANTAGVPPTINTTNNVGIIDLFSEHQSDDGLFELTPDISLNGSKKNEITLNVPTFNGLQIQYQVAATRIYAVFFAKGFLVVGGSNLGSLNQ